MSAISAMPEAIAQWLSARAELAGIGFLTEYPALSKAVPLRRAMVAVGVDAVELTDKFVANDDGVLERQEYCRTADIRLRLDIHVPYAEGGARCHEIFALVLDLLSFASDLEIPASGCGEIKSQRDTDAFVLEAWAQIVADFCPAESTGLVLSSFISKELLCGGHIGDAAIHLSAAQAAWVNSPCRAGSYTGNGVASRTVEVVGGQPRAVVVFAKDLPLITPSFTGGVTQNYFGFATAGGGSMGIELASAGFRLKSGSSVNAGTNQAALNQSATAYCYFAWM
ncbi:MAG: hypothetical protein LBC83_01215 [Oscillospiraceae bacterium]|jgi:hypothetical protein|nr:hypothetical protein [Oscillospiraceae bacterium]